MGIEATVEAPVYPDWQTRIREGQAYVAAEERERQAHYAKVEQEEKLQRGKELSTALSYLGIVITPPDEGKVTLDGITFELSGTVERFRSIAASGGGESINFALHIGYEYPEKYRALSEARENYQHINWVQVNQVIDDDWSGVYAKVADAIDGAIEGAQKFMARMDAEAAKEPEPTLPQHTSTAKYLDRLIRQIVREEVSTESGW